MSEPTSQPEREDPARIHLLEIRVQGVPAPQGSKRHVGGGRMIESSKNLPPWREAVKWAAADAIRRWEQCYAREWLPATGPVTTSMHFRLARPSGHLGTGRNATRLRPSAPKHPAVPPDLSKLVRATEDALTDAGVWRDDALVVSIHTTKTYADRPGASIVVATDRRPT